MSYVKSNTSRRHACPISSSGEDTIDGQSPHRCSYAQVLATPSPPRRNPSPQKVGRAEAKERYVSVTSLDGSHF